VLIGVGVGILGVRIGAGVGAGIGVTCGGGVTLGGGVGAAFFKRRRSVFSAVCEDDGSVAVTFTVTACWPRSAGLSVTEILKLPRAPAVVVPLNWPVPVCDAPAVTRIRAFSAVVPATSNVRATVSFSSGKRMVREIGAGAARRTVKDHERSNAKPPRPRPVTLTVWLAKSSGAGGL
jgi:hypothetical protein